MGVCVGVQCREGDELRAIILKFSSLLYFLSNITPLDCCHTDFNLFARQPYCQPKKRSPMERNQWLTDWLAGWMDGWNHNFLVCSSQWLACVLALRDGRGFSPYQVSVIPTVIHPVKNRLNGVARRLVLGPKFFFLCVCRLCLKGDIIWQLDWHNE